MNPPRSACRLLAAGLLALLLGACSTPATRVVLLPQQDGSPSAVVVRTPDGERVLSQPYQRATAHAGERQAPTLDQADPAQLRAQHPTLFDLLPPTPRVYTLYFDSGGTALTAQSQQLVPQLLAAAAARTGADIVVTGHTDTTGPGPQNDTLSLRRAQEIRLLLVQHGFPAERIEAVGRGERELAVPTPDNMDEPRNRRVVIEVR